MATTGGFIGQRVPLPAADHGELAPGLDHARPKGAIVSPRTRGWKSTAEPTAPPTHRGVEAEVDTQPLGARRQDVAPTTETVSTKVGGLDQAASVFISARPGLFKIAYRILGSVTEAEDVVQDVWLRWQRTDRAVVLDPPAFLAATATRLAINVAQSARRRHEAYAGPWLPEPVDSSVGPEMEAERRDAVEAHQEYCPMAMAGTDRSSAGLTDGGNGCDIRTSRSGDTTARSRGTSSGGVTLRPKVRRVASQTKRLTGQEKQETGLVVTCSAKPRVYQRTHPTGQSTLKGRP